MSKKKKNKLPANVRPTSQKLNKQKQSGAQVTTQQFSGPVPHPEILRGYEQILPGAAKRILSMAELDQKHQIEIESSAQHLAAREIKRGQIFGLVVSISAFITSITSLILGFEKAAMVIGGTTVVGLVTVFVTSRSKKSD